MSTLSSALAISKPADGDTSWGDEHRNAMDTIDWLHQPNNCYFVSPAFSISNLFPYGAPANRRHFDTIQGAITAAENTDVHTTVFIYPDSYAESLTFTKDVGLVGLTPAKGRSMRGANKVGIYGQGTSPVITFTPGAGIYPGISFTNIEFGHHYNTVSGSTQTWPLLLDVIDQGAGNYGTFHNSVSFSNCYFRKDSLTDEFDFCMRSYGKNKVMIDDCDFKFPTGTGNFQYPIAIEGNDANAVDGVLMLRNTAFNHSGGDDQTIWMSNRANGLYKRCDSIRALADIVTFGGVGSNSCSGLNNATDFTNHGNLFGISGAGI